MTRTRGSVSVEAVMIIPAFLLFLALIAAIGRTAVIREDLHSTAVNASRVASQQTSALEGERAARKVIADQLSGGTCRTLDISLNTAALDYAPGRPGSVSVTISCVVGLSDLSVPGLPGQIRLTETFTTPIDTYTDR